MSSEAINEGAPEEGEDAPPPAAGEPPETSPSQIAAVPASGGGGDEAEGAAAAASEERKPSMKEPSPKASGTSTGKKDSEKKGSLKRGSLFGDKGGALQDNTLKDTLQEFFSNAPKEQDEKSTALKPLRRPKLIYENTYRLESQHPFSPSRVQTVIENILEDMLGDFKYSSKTSATKAMEVAEKIRRNVLAFRFDRYKICVLVTISPLNRQGFFNGFRCLWDANRDSYAAGTMRNPSIIAIGVCYGVYFE